MMRSLIAPLLIAIAVVVAAWIAASAFRYHFAAAETISVTGLADTNFTADQIVWRATFTRQGAQLKEVYALLKSDEQEIKGYLNSAGIPDSNIVFKSVEVQRNYNTRFDENGRMTGNEFSGYNLTGTVVVDSRNTTVVEKASREITTLLQKGIELNSIPPSYYYSGLNALKIDLLANAARDARQRAASIAEHSGATLGSIKKATMGVFQITGKNMNEEYSYGGVFNTTSKEKTATITLRVEYGLK